MTANEDLFRRLLDAGDFGIVVLAPDARVMLWNDWMVRASAIAAGQATGRTLETLFPAIASTRIPRAVADAVKSGLSSVLSRGLNRTLFPLFHKTGGAAIEHMVTVKALPMGEEDDHCLIQITDITKAVRREEMLRRQARTTEALAESYRLSELRTRAIVDSALDGIITFDESGIVETFNPAAEQILERRADDAVGQAIDAILAWPEDARKPEDRAPGGLWKRLAADREIHECTGLRPGGASVPLEMSVGEMEFDGSRLFIAMLRDVSLRLRAEERVRFMAHHDVLTGLPNRALFHERLERVKAQTRRTDHRFAVMLLDLDRFKDVNDTFGHHVGDLLLTHASRRIAATVRESDTVARLGGDEFAVLLTNIAEVGGAGTVAVSIVDTVGKPFDLDGNEVVTSASIGISIYPDDSEDIHTLLKNADLALYRSKAKGRNTYQFYVPEMDVLVQAQKTMERELRTALEREDLSLAFQPLVDASNGSVSGAEALVRWNHQERGSIAAQEFIPVAEKTDLILPLGKWVIRKACAQAKAWQEAGLPPVTLSVNLSAVELRHGDLGGVVEQTLKETGLDPKYLQLEFGEATFLLAVNSNIQVLNRLRDLGVKISIDDFGTGVSSLDHLKRFPVDQLKIATTFLEAAGDASDRRSLFAALVMLGHSLGATVDVEGVETGAHLEFVLRSAIEEMQGYYLSHPVSAEEFASMLTEGAPLADTGGETSETE